jgi:hypothetical protein
MIGPLGICPICFETHVREPRVDDLCALFVWAALKTWRDLQDSNRLGASISEDSITDMLLLEMARRTRYLAYKRYTRHEESKTSGADWLWWFVSGNRGFPLLVQAKRLFGGKTPAYSSLKYAGRRSDQTNVLLRHAKRQGWLPIFCFYNFWDRAQPWAGGPAVHQRELWGCAVAPAGAVKRKLVKADNSLASIGPVSKPWLRLVCPGSERSTVVGANELPDTVRDELQRAFRLRSVPEVSEQLPDEVRRLLLGRVGDEASVAPEELGFLRGIVVVSDRPIEREG